MKEMIWHKHKWPENVKKTLEYPNKPLYTILEDTADKSGELPYTIWSGTTTTYKETEEAANKVVYFMSIDKAKFRAPVRPGDKLEYRVDMIKQKGAIWVFDGKAYVDDSLVAQAELKAMIVDK